MTDSIPDTVTNALEAVPVEDATALEAGAGVGNGTAGLLAADAETVYSVTDEVDHAETVRERCPAATVLQADLGAIPLPDDTVDVVVAHGLFNVLPNETAAAVAAELTRVAAPGGWLVIDDYGPHPSDSRIRRLFAVENALAELAAARPAYVFYPADELRTLFEGHGWTHERTTTLLDPVPWTQGHMDAHVDAARRAATGVPDEVADPLLRRAERLAAEGADPTGRMYSLALRHEA
ncbi:class I SAM-dependent methyltransferase [Halobaculum litoreum]|uniref:Class I SAM-dependent methyltransferase n=1 Tax=Halobaculum litoreum TaxID=3031998 RepID=A0ABD5XQW8_9EURY|nr:class I SAM-dependent methyltransferase [Halobaculum sp. DT92]